MSLQRPHYDPKAVHWNFGNTPVRYESETCSQFMSEDRNKQVRKAIREQQGPDESAKAMLRESHINLSMRKELPTKSEAQTRWTKQPIEVSESFKDVRIAELRKCNIDLAVAEPKTGKEWTSVLKSVHGANEDLKFACKKPEGFQELGAELRKSSVLLHAGRHDFRSSSLPVRRSEAKAQYVGKPISVTANLSATLGKELRTSSFDYSYGVSKSSAHWQSQQHHIMASHNDKKWACEKPEGFNHLIAELRKTNVTLGTDSVDYGTEGNRRPVRDDRNMQAAGDLPGL